MLFLSNLNHLITNFSYCSKTKIIILPYKDKKLIRYLKAVKSRTKESINLKVLF